MSKTMKVVGGPHFSSVRKAREALKERANEILDGLLNTVKMAAANGEYETAVKGYQYLMDHMPDEDGVRMVDGSIDKKILTESGPKGPTIQIGVQIGGLKTTTEAIEAAPIDVTPDE